jgi:hypothetical protein
MMFERITCYFHLQATEQNPFNLYRQAIAPAKCAERVGLARSWNGREEVIFKSEWLATGCLKMQYFLKGNDLYHRDFRPLCLSYIKNYSV